MSQPAHNPDERPFRGGKRALVLAIAAAVLGAAVALALDATQALASYLIAYSFAVTVVIGLIAFVMGAHAMSATWPTAIRRLAELGFATLPLLIVLYVPLLWSTGLYPWAHPERIADHHVRELVLHKRPVMNAPFFFIRAFAFLLMWTIAAELLRAGSLAMDRPGAPDRRDRLRVLSSVLLPFIGLTATFAMFDWIMSLSPDFYSTMYGLYVLSGGFVAALGLLAILMLAAQRSGRLVAVNRSHWYAVGRLLFAFLIFWAYTGFFQYLLIWIGNKPLEARFYVERFHPGDYWTSQFLVWGHFVAPWLILLSYTVKRRRATVTALGAWLLACHYVDMHWLVGAGRGARPWQWPDAPALVLVGGACVAFALWRQRGHLVSAAFAPDYADAVEYESR
jgi:hypothetical protein